MCHMYMYMYMSMCMYTTVQYVHTSVYMYLQCTSVYTTVQYVHTCKYIDVCKAPTLPLQETRPAPACKDYVHTCVHCKNIIVISTLAKVTSVALYVGSVITMAARL